MTECEANHRMEGRDAVLLKYEYNSVLVSDSFIYVTEIMFQMKEETRREKFKCWLTLGMKHEGVDACVGVNVGLLVWELYRNGHTHPHQKGVSTSEQQF